MTAWSWRRVVVAVAAACAAGAVLALSPQVDGAAEPQVRAPAVAGSFYPADPERLQRMVDDLLARARPPEVKEPLVALVVPHAGYQFSGEVAANAYALLRGRKLRRVVVISPSHHESFPFAAVYDGDAYATPLGRVWVDKEFAARLAKDNLVKLSSRGHARTGPQGEHSLEVQLPFLQRALGDFALVPVVMGEQSFELSRALGVAIARAARDGETLIVASSDLSHFHDYDQAAAMDNKVLRTLEDWDYLSLARGLRSGVWEACGAGPVMAAMMAAERLGGNRARLLRYMNSGDVTGEKTRVVGYGAVALVRQTAAGAEEAAQLTEAERKELLAIARQSVEAAVRYRKYEPPAPKLPALLAERGAFVTLKKRGELRGCIGYIMAAAPLYLIVHEVAELAALRDSRFPPVEPDELGQLEYEISVLTPFRRVSDVRQVEVGRHGLLVRKGTQEGLLLPQVPVEQRWDRRIFVEQTCIKAGLHRDAWLDADTDVFVFSALVFGRE